MPAIRAFVVVVILLLGGGCSRSVSPPGGVAGAPAAPAAVERFLQLAAAKDYNGMGWVFGTVDGPIFGRDDASQVEQRMYALASLLEHDGFVVGPPAPVPGRSQEASQFDVTLMRGGQSVHIPVTAVRGPRNRWFVENIRVDAGG